MTLPRDDTTIFLPTLNEAGAIGRVIDGFKEHGYTNILVIDGNSSDGTVDEAREHGATVQQQTGTGKGNAVQDAFEAVSTPYMLMADGDGTYAPDDADAMLRPLVSGDANHTLGNRFADIDAESMDISHQFGNRSANLLFATLYGHYRHDILSGYHGFTAESMDAFQLSEGGFGIETEIAIQTVENPAIRTQVVPITYHPRAGETESKLSLTSDVPDILETMIRRRFQKPDRP